MQLQVSTCSDCPFSDASSGAVSGRACFHPVGVDTATWPMRANGRLDGCPLEGAAVTVRLMFSRSRGR